MKLCIAIVVVLVAVCMANPDEKWQHHKRTFAKRFGDKEHEERARQRFMVVDAVIEEHNRKAETGEETYFMDHNQFSTLDRNKSIHYMGLLHDPNEKSHRKNMHIVEGKAVPTKFDWRQKGWNTPVKNQQQCGCCWSFSTTETIEAQYKIKKGQTVLLSQQELIDCAKNPPLINGCQGATVPAVFEHISKKGVAAAEKYPFKASDKNRCQKVSGTRYTIKSIKSAETVPAIKELLVSHGPLAVAVHANDGFMHYKSGIFSGSDGKGGMCSNQINHAVTLVGYDEKAWILRNEWGKWGENGYIRVKMGDVCGITVQAVAPVI